MRIRMLGLLASGALSMPAVAADLTIGQPLTGAPAGFAPFYSFYAHVGPAGLFPDVGAKIKIGGVRLPGATISIAPSATAAVEIGYRFTPNWAVSLAGGIPPTSVLDGAGTIAPYGKLGSTLSGPIALTAHYHFAQFGAFQPYIGAGATYMIVFDSKDGALSHLRVDSALGAVGQVGADMMLTDRLGVFFDIKKAYLRTTASGVLGLPIKTVVRLDPLALSGGVTYRF